MRNNKVAQNKNKKTLSIINLRFGFTIVEIMVVVVVIGILATIGSLSYSGWQTSAVTAAIKSDLSGVATAMENYRNFNSKYPTSGDISDIFKSGPDITLTFASRSDTAFCINAKSTKNSSLKYYIDQNSGPKGVVDGSCPEVIPPQLPNAPSDFIIVNTSSSSIDLSWTTVTGATSYTLQRDTSSSFTSPKTDNIPSTSSSFTSTGLSQGVEYYYRINITGATGTSNWSNIINESTSITVPVMTDITVVTSGSTTVWSWLPAICASGTTASYQYDYTISSYYDSHSAVFDYGWVSNGSNLSVSFTTSTIAQNYTITVQAKCSSPNTFSDWSASVLKNYIRPITWDSVIAGDKAACGTASNNQIYCWGEYMLISGSANYIMYRPAFMSTFNTVMSNKTIKSISPMSDHSNGIGNSSCVLTNDSQPYCWGGNWYGQLGDGSTTSHENKPTPVAVNTTGVLIGKTIKSIVTSGNHTCVIAGDNSTTTTDKIYCWGYNRYGQLGNNLTTNSSIPVTVDTSGVLSGKTIKSIAAADSYTCVIASDNKVYCWGRNTEGELGNNSTANSSVPVAVYTSGVLSGKTVKSISAIHSDHTCVIAGDSSTTTNDKVYCWGANDKGQLGNNSTANSSVPVAVNTSGVLSGKTIKSITTNINHTCAIASDDKAYCWGWNDDGQLGNNSIANSSVPVAVNTSGVLSGKTVKSIANGTAYTCVVASDSQIYCWGDNWYGLLGIGGTTPSYITIPTAVLTPAKNPPSNN